MTEANARPKPADDLQHDVRHGERKVVLLGGRHSVSLFPGSTTNIPSVDGSSSAYMHLDYLGCGSAMAGATLDIMAALLSTCSTGYAVAVNSAVRQAFQSGCFNFESPIGMDAVRIWAQRCNPSLWSRLKAYLVRLSAFRSAGHVDDGVRKFLDRPERFEEQGRGAYFSLLVNDVDRGALTRQELRSIQSGLNDAYSEKSIDFTGYALAWLLITTGLRPMQVARMTLGDVRIEPGTDSRNGEVYLSVPIVKSRRASKLEHWERRAPPLLADLLSRHIAFRNGDSSDSPLFFNTSLQVCSHLKKVFRRVSTYSERTGGPVRVTAYRFRYTLATSMVLDGCTDVQVARVLTHRTLQAVRYYRASLPAHQRQVEARIGKEMDAIAKSFQGRVVEDLRESTFGGSTDSLIRDFRNLQGQTVGACGMGSGCGLHAPLACLSCRKFEPLVHAPWDILIGQIREAMMHETDSHVLGTVRDMLEAAEAVKAACEARIREKKEEGR